MSNQITAWSYSRLKNFEKCPYQVYLGTVMKEPGPDKDPTVETPADRGSRIHKEAEDYVQGLMPELPKSLRKFEGEFKALREQFTESLLEIEQDWGFDNQWARCDWFGDEIWLRVKCDVVVHYDDKDLTIIDHKTGKKFGNEVPHIQQAQLYAISAFMRYPEAENISVEFWYLDEGTKLKKLYTRSSIIQPLNRFTERAEKLTSCIEFKPKANKFNCKWCDYGPNKGTGSCPYGVEA